MENDKVPDEVKITHMHSAKIEADSFIEFVKMDNAKTYILQFNHFVKRYGLEMIEAFKSKKWVMYNKTLLRLLWVDMRVLEVYL